MAELKRAVIQGAGHAIPSRVLTNQDIEKLVDTTDEWIRQRTGIQERRVAEPAETSSVLGARAARMALENAGAAPEEVELVVVATVTGDMMFPSTACLVQQQLGLKNAGAMDVGAACAGFVYALQVAGSMIESGAVGNALVIGSDVLTRFVDWSDRSTCVLFGDGAGAVFVRGETETNRGLIKSLLCSDGDRSELIDLQIGGSRNPIQSAESASARRYIFMAGQEVFRFAVVGMGDACCRVLELAGMSSDEIDLFVPHQANLRIIDAAAKRLELPPERVFVNVQKYGNTSGGSIPLALSEAAALGKLRKGMVAMTVGFGAGLVWGANLIRW